MIGPRSTGSLTTCRRCCWPYLQGLRPAHAPAGSGRCSALAVLPGHSPPKRGRRAKEMRPSPGPRRERQGNQCTCGTPRRRTHARLIGRQTRPPPGRAVSRSVADRRVTRAKAAHRARTGYFGSGDPLTHQSSHRIRVRSRGVLPCTSTGERPKRIQPSALRFFKEHRHGNRRNYVHGIWHQRLPRM